MTLSTFRAAAFVCAGALFLGLAPDLIAREACAAPDRQDAEMAAPSPDAAAVD